MTQLHPRDPENGQTGPILGTALLEKKNPVTTGWMGKALLGLLQVRIDRIYREIMPSSFPLT